MMKNSEHSVQRRNRLLLTIFATWIMAWALLFLSALSLPNYLSDVNVDDAFYYLAIAQNIAEGRGSTFDSLHYTNGHHPAWTYLLALLSYGTNDILEFLEYAKILELALVLIGIFVFCHTGLKSGVSAITLFAAGCYWLITRDLYVGMEAGLHFLCLILVLPATKGVFQRPHEPKTWILLASLLATLPWVRLESIVVGIGYPFFVFGYFCAKRQKFPKVSLLLLLIPCASSLLYFALQYVNFGSAFPISGAVKRFWSTLKMGEAEGMNVLDNLTNTITFMPYASGLIAGVVGLLIVFLSWRISAYHSDRYQDEHAMDAFILALTLAHVGRTALSALYFHPLWSVYGWYVVHAIILVPTVLILTLHRIRILVHWSSETPRLLFHTAVNLLVLLVIGYYTIFAHAFYRFLSIPDKMKMTSQNSWALPPYYGAQWMNEKLPPDVIIGSADAGIVGYFSERPVVNLDGLVNSVKYFKAMSQQRLADWLSESGVTHFANVFPAGKIDGCEAMADRTRQQSAFPGKCTLLYESETYILAGREFAFRVYGYDPGS